MVTEHSEDEANAKSKSAAEIVEALIPIWQRVLQRPSIGEQENFFELGGSPVLAAKVFDEIAQVFARELSPVTICQAPTIAALAGVLANPTAPRIPPLVLLKAGANKLPVFITHGVGGNVLELFDVAKHIRSPHPIYGMQARGINGLDEPFDRIEDMAQFFLDAIKEIQPHGPYALIGYSLGGLVTFEMAQRLAASGENVALLAMLESYPDKRYLPLKQRLRLFSRLAKHHSATLIRLPLRHAVSYLTHPAVRLKFRPGQNDGSRPNREPVNTAQPAVLQRMRDSGYLALKRYRPSLYHGKIKFVRAQFSFGFPDDPAPFWAKLADQLEVETVPGDHGGIIATQFESLAVVLSRYLHEAFAT
jgi:acetoacetyl-CoA synthetase